MDEVAEVARERRRTTGPLAWAAAAAVLVALAVAGVVLAFPERAAPWLEAVGISGLRGEAPPLRIAVAGAVGETADPADLAMLRGAQIFADRVNAARGVAGRPLEIVALDDARDPARAAAAARDLAETGRVLAVIGHSTSGATLAAAEIYAEAGIPVISPMATHPAVTAENPWAFRTIFNDDQQAKILANYARSVLGYQSLAVVNTETAYARYLTRALEESAAEIGLNVEPVYTVTAASDPAEIRDIARRLSLMGALDAVLLILRPGQAEGLVPLLRAGGLTADLIGADTLSLFGISEGGDARGEDESAIAPFLDGMLLTVPFLPETASAGARAFLRDYEARHGEPAPWSALLAHDTAEAIARAVGKLDRQTVEAELAGLRAAVRDELAAMTTPETAVAGLTGPIFFDAVGDIVPPIYLGRVNHGRMRTAPQQLTTIRDENTIERLLEEGADAVEIDGALLQVTQVVTTGIHLGQITEIDTASNTFRAEFEIWFRYQGSFDPNELVFPDAVAPIRLEAPSFALDGERESYRVFEVDAVFQFRTDLDWLCCNQQDFRIRYFHSDRDANRLVLLPDQRSMGALSERRSWAEALREAQVIDPGTGWVIGSASVSQESENRSTLGNPLIASIEVPFSAFVAEIAAYRGEISLKRELQSVLPAHRSWGALAALVVALGLTFVTRLKRDYPVTTLVVRLALTAVIMLVFEDLLFASLGADLQIYQLEILALTFKSLWWIIPAVWVIYLLRRLVWDRIEQRTGYPVPSIARLFVNLLVIIVTAALISTFVFGQSMTSLWAASGVLTVVLGIALQSLILDAFAGLMLNIERPFKIGDKIMLDDDNELCGHVIEMTWRTTKIRTEFYQEIKVIPNSAVSNSKILNFAQTGPLWVGMFVVLDHDVPSEDVVRLLFDGVEAARGKGSVLDLKGEVVTIGWEIIGMKYLCAIKIDRNKHSKASGLNVLVTEIERAMAKHGLKSKIPLHKIDIKDAAAAAVVG
ncbi:MAG: ABC transporter substrate-binding protein [Paracoccaceae bacterium]